MTFPALLRFLPLGLLMLRWMVAAIFIVSGWIDLKIARGARQEHRTRARRSQSSWESQRIAGGLGIAFGVLTPTRRVRPYPDRHRSDL